MVPFALNLEMHYFLNSLLCYPSPLYWQQGKTFCGKKRKQEQVSLFCACAFVSYMKANCATRKQTVLHSEAQFLAMGNLANAVIEKEIF